MVRIEATEARLKRMRMRAWRRGTKEMDLILGPFADAALGGLSEPDLAVFDQVLEQNDQDLLPWVLGQNPAPQDLAAMIERIATAARSRLTPG